MARAQLRLVEKATRSAHAAPAAPHAYDDTELLAAVRAGDEQAAAAFHDRLRPRVDRTVARLLGRRDPDCEDLAQLSFVEIVRSIRRYRGECSLESWASTIAAHVVYKHIRRRKLERRIFASAAADETLHAHPVSVSRALTARDLTARVRDELGRVSHDRAWAFLLHDVCGFDLKEMATILDVTVSAAQQRLVRGRRDIHERLASDPELANALSDLTGGGGG
jgi:RNA polymerase sigma-70 factor (ECF subfamily)